MVGGPGRYFKRRGKLLVEFSLNPGAQWYPDSELLNYAKHLSEDLKKIGRHDKKLGAVSMGNPRICEEPELKRKSIVFDAYAPNPLDVKVALITLKSLYESRREHLPFGTKANVLMSRRNMDGVYVENSGHDRSENPWMEVELWKEKARLVKKVETKKADMVIDERGLTIFYKRGGEVIGHLCFTREDWYRGGEYYPYDKEISVLRGQLKLFEVDPMIGHESERATDLVDDGKPYLIKAGLAQLVHALEPTLHFTIHKGSGDGTRYDPYKTLVEESLE